MLAMERVSAVASFFVAGGALGADMMVVGGEGGGQAPVPAATP